MKLTDIVKGMLNVYEGDHWKQVCAPTWVLTIWDADKRVSPALVGHCASDRRVKVGRIILNLHRRDPARKLRRVA